MQPWCLCISVALLAAFVVITLVERNATMASARGKQAPEHLYACLRLRELRA
ncbi:MAG: hypothetical protein IJB26_04010 [Clostridia bacterium]|nr:hypothetical protein [Clostridia bacterium]